MENYISEFWGDILKGGGIKLFSLQQFYPPTIKMAGNTYFKFYGGYFDKGDKINNYMQTT